MSMPTKNEIDVKMLGIALLVYHTIKSTYNQGSPTTLVGLGYYYIQGHMYLIPLVKCCDSFHSTSFQQLLLTYFQVSIMLLVFLPP
jgi:hypothetical protein